MVYKKILLDETDENIYLEAYIADKIGDYVRKAILVIPGGGYGNICSDREGEPIAMAFMPYGYNAFVLHYSVSTVNDRKFPNQLIEASKAIKHIRDNADEYNINPDKVFATGFSAGGHLCASLGILWNMKEVYDAVDMPYGYNKPTGIMPIYPVITPEYHMVSFENLLGKENCTPELLEKTNLYKHVNKDSAPAYIMHTSNDGVVDVRNSLLLANAYAEAGLEFELHVYPDAPHGVALGNEITECNQPKYNNPCIAKWIENASLWADSIIKRKD